jgi:hypothetical protein
MVISSKVFFGLEAKVQKGEMGVVVKGSIVVAKTEKDKTTTCDFLARHGIYLRPGGNFNVKLPPGDLARIKL